MRISVMSLLLVMTVAIVNTACDGGNVGKLPTEINRPTGKDLEVYWELKENGYKGASKSLTEFTIKNNSEHALGKNWALYFHQPRKIDFSTVTANVAAEHINGDYFKIYPTDSFELVPSGGSVSIQFVNDAWFLKSVDAPTGIYVVFTKANGEEAAPEELKNVTVLPIAKGDKVAIDGKNVLDVPTAKSTFVKYSKNSVVAKDSVCPITPTPLKYVKNEGVFEISAGSTIAFVEGLENEAGFLAKKLSADYGLDLKETKGEKGAIKLSVDSSLSESQDAYQLVIGAEGVSIVGSSVSGVFYGVQSLRALAAVEKIGEKNSSLSFNYCEVEDSPRFEYRGIHLDVARNFQNKESVLKLLDASAFYKLNKFHFHICDDEGWRLEIAPLPELTEVGSKRGHSKDETEMINPAYGSGPYPAENSAGTGHYSTEDFIEILKYAKERHIEVIPELDFPGHARAAIISMKARQRNLEAKGNKEGGAKYILHDPKDESEYLSVQLYNDNVINVCQESTYDFLEVVVSEVVSMYKEAGLKLENVHIGGDEVPHHVWEKSPNCVAFLAENPQYNKASDLFYYFVGRFSDILGKHGVVTAGWEEIGLRKVMNEDDEEVPVVNEEFLKKGFRPYVWNTVWGWGAEDRGYKLANAGYKIVLSNVNALYFDLAYDKDPNDPGYYWGGFVDTRKSWGFIPLDFYSETILNNFNNPLPASMADGKERLTEEGKKNILGIQGQLWSETVKSSDMMEYYYFPKMLGLVERAWAQDPKWSELPKAERMEQTQLDWNVFSSRMGYYDLPRLAKLSGGMNYRIAPPGAIIKKGKLHANSLYPGFEIRYTTNGTEPETSSALYTKPVRVRPGLEIKLKCFDATGASSKTTTL